MVTYKCFRCGNKVKKEELGKRFVCSSCGNKIFYKPRTKTRKVKAE